MDLENKPKVCMTKEQFEEIEKENHEVMKDWPKNFPYFCHTIEELSNMIDLNRKNKKMGQEILEYYYGPDALKKLENGELMRSRTFYFKNEENNNNE